MVDFDGFWKYDRPPKWTSALTLKVSKLLEGGVFSMSELFAWSFKSGEDSVINDRQRDR